MIERARFWWDGRAPRERTLLAVLGGLTLALLIWLLVLRPIDGAKAAAAQRLDTATLDRGRVLAATMALKLAQRTAPPALTQPLVGIVGQAAATGGFAVSRLDAQSADRVNVAIANVGGSALFAWLSALERQGIIPERLSVRTNSDATLAVDGVLRVRGR